MVRELAKDLSLDAALRATVEGFFLHSLSSAILGFPHPFAFSSLADEENYSKHGCWTCLGSKDEVYFCRHMKTVALSYTRPKT